MIKLFATDVDGSLTDGCMYYTDDGREMKKFHFRDGHGFQLLREAGLKTVILTAETSPIVKMRADKLRVDFLQMGCQDKLDYMQRLCKKLGISMNEVAYIGDDVNDVPLLRVAGRAACPSDAHRCVRELPGIIRLQTGGGHGAVREFIDSLLVRMVSDNADHINGK